MARFIIRMLLLVVLALGVLYALQLRAPGPPLPPVLDLPQHTVRIALEGRPADLPIYSLHPLFSDKVNLDIQVIEQPGERWRLLAAGEIDLVVSTLDEFALAVPRYNPGQIIFPVALSIGSDAVVAHAKTPPGELRVAYVSGSPGETMMARLAARPDHPYAVVPISAPDARTARAWYESGQVGAVATCEPYLSNYLAHGDEALIRTTPEEPITQVWVASRQSLLSQRLPRVNRQDLQQVADAWFLLMARLQAKPGLAVGAIARDNEISVEEVEKSFLGLKFYTLSEVGAITSPQLQSQLLELATDGALRGALNAVKPGSFEADIDLSILDDLHAPEMPAPTPEASLSPSPEQSPLVTPSPLLEPPEDDNPFSPTPMHSP